MKYTEKLEHWIYFSKHNVWAEISVLAFHFDVQKYCECMQVEFASAAIRETLSMKKTCTELDDLPSICIISLQFLLKPK